MSSFLSGSSTPGMFLLSVHAKPGARSSSVVAPLRLDDEAIQVRIAAPPVEGKANAELVDYMQSALEHQVRELAVVLTQAPSSSSAWEASAESFFAGTSYKNLLERSAATQPAPPAVEEATTSKKAKSKKGAQSSRAAASAPRPSSGAVLSLGSRLASRQSCPISVELARGSTSKTKSLALQFPGNEAELVGMLQRIAEE